MKRFILGAVIGAIPGIVLIVLTGPIEGEIELTLGVSGIFLGFAGLIAGALVAAKRK